MTKEQLAELKKQAAEANSRYALALRAYKKAKK